jgi:pyruvate dehydrogenase E1 component beta subunit
MEQNFAPLEVGSDPVFSEVVLKGRDITVVTYGEGVLEAILAARELAKVGVELEVIDLKCLSHVEYGPIVSSLAITRRLIAVDPYSPRFGVCSEVVSRLVSETSVDLKEPPIILSPPFIPVPTAPEMAAEFYAKTDKNSIIRASGDMMGVKVEAHSLNLADATFPPKTKIGKTWEVL